MFKKQHTLPDVQALVDAAIEKKLAHLRELIDERVSAQFSRRLLQRVNFPAVDAASPFMRYSSCSAADFAHPRYIEICKQLFAPPLVHRKLWEWVYIVHQVHRHGLAASGRRGLAFGVGNESLPAFFAGRGVEIMATDAPPEIGLSGGWTETTQHAQGLQQLRQPHLCADADFDRLVSYRHCDMNHIDPALVEFDFLWSSCSLEHLGSLQAGADFVLQSTEKCLKPGGIGIHTTELNVSSEVDTLSTGPTVLYRPNDIAQLIEQLAARGHTADPFVQAPDVHVMDLYVDVPPYSKSPHLKLELGSFVSTSVGLVVRRADH